MSAAEVGVEIGSDVTRAACEGCSLNGGEKAVGECALIGALSPRKETVLAQSAARILAQATRESFSIADIVAEQGEDGPKNLYQQTNMGLQAVRKHPVLGAAITELDPAGKRKNYALDLEALQDICQKIESGEINENDIDLSKNKSAAPGITEESIAAATKLTLIGSHFIIRGSLFCEADELRELVKVCNDEQVVTALRHGLNLVINADNYRNDIDAQQRLSTISAICRSDVGEGTKTALLDLLAPEEKPTEKSTGVKGDNELEEAKGWQDFANCLGVDPDLFFPERGASTREAKEVCKGCVVREDCLEYALSNGEKFGIWGGLSERERRRIRKQRAQDRRTALDSETRSKED